MASQTPSPNSDPRIDDLQAEVERIKGEMGSRDTTPAEPHNKWRSFWSAVLIVVACVLAPLSAVSVWARGEVTDTQRYIATIAPLASDPAIQNAVATRATNEILTQLDIDGLTQDAVSAISENRDLTPQASAALTVLAGPLKSGIEGFIGDTVTKFVYSDRFGAIWIQVNTKVHDEFNALLSGSNDGAVSLEGDEVVLDVGAVVAEVKNDLVARGLTIADKIPAVESTIVLFQSEGVQNLQTAYSLLNTVGFWLPIIVALLAIIGIFVANVRRKAMLGFGVGLTLMSMLAGLLMVVGRTAYLNGLPETANYDAAVAFFDQITYFLRQTFWAGFALGVILILAAILTGPSRFAVGLRGLLVQFAEQIQALLYNAGATMTSLRQWVAGAVTGLRLAAVLIAAVFVLIQRYKTVELMVWTTVGLLVALFIIQVFASDAVPEVADTEDHATTPLPAGADS